MSIDFDGLKDRTDIVSVIGSYVDLKKRGAEYVGLCPFHADKTPSFYVVPVKKFAHCFACGWSGDVLDFIREKEGIGTKEAAEHLGATTEWTPKPITHAAPSLPDRVTWKPPADAPPCRFKLGPLGEPSRTWEYRDTDGGLLGYVARYDSPDGKQIRCWSWGARGNAEAGWGCGHFNKPRPLYGLDRLAAKPKHPVMVVEGEKTADAAAAMLSGYAVIAWPGGAKAWKHVDLAPLRGRRVDFWPDNDEPGREAMQGLAAVVADPAGLNCHGKMIDPADKPPGFDAADWSEADGELMPWLKAHATWYRDPNAPIPPKQNPAPPVAAHPSPGSQAADNSGPAVGTLPPDPAAPAGAGPAETAPDSPPDAVVVPLEAYSGDAKPQPGKRRPRLRSVDGGNTVPKPDPDAEPLPESMSEDALAEHFIEVYGNQWRYCTEWNLWLQWKGDGWHRDKRNEVSDVCKIVTRQALEWPESRSLPPSTRQKINSKRTAWNARDLAAADRRISILAELLDADPMMLGVPGGVVDLRNGKLLDAEPEQYITRRCTVMPQEGPHPLFDRVLERACAGHDGMREYLLRWFGYMLTGEVSEEAFMFLHGPGGSGKSTLIKCITEIMGDYATTINMEALTETKAPRHSQEIAKLEGARLVYASETEEGRRFNESLIKWLTGGDKIVAHRMRMDDREFKPTFKILIYGNSVPHLKSVGEEMRRRIHLVEYAGSLTPEERDTTLKQRLVEEYPAILATLIRGCVDWQDCRGLGKPESVAAAVETYLDGEDSLAAFLEECADRDPNGRELSGEVYRRYRTWAANAGEYVMSQKRLVGALEKRGFDRVRSGGARYISGLKLRQAVPEDAPAPGWYRDN